MEYFSLSLSFSLSLFLSLSLSLSLSPSSLKAHPQLSRERKRWRGGGGVLLFLSCCKTKVLKHGLRQSGLTVNGLRAEQTLREPGRLPIVVEKGLLTLLNASHSREINQPRSMNYELRAIIDRSGFGKSLPVFTRMEKKPTCRAMSTVLLSSGHWRRQGHACKHAESIDCGEEG